MTRIPSQADFNREVVDTTTYGYVQEYGFLENGSKFSFDGHNYLVQIYCDDHPYMVIEKSAQMGVSIYAIFKALSVADKKGKNVIYFFPTDTDVMDFSKTRVGPIIENSPHLSEVVGKNDALGLRQVGNGWLYMRGMVSKIAMKSIPADFLVFDELDETSHEAEKLADKRLLHSKLRWRLKLSTPTYENYGIDREFKKSDQHYWNLICQHCNTRTITEFEQFDCVKRLSETTAVLICRRCKRELNTQYGEWIPEHPENSARVRGYHICGLYSTYTNLSEVLYEYESGEGRDELMRSNLGLPYVSAEMRITRDMVEACCTNYEMHTDRNTYMGVDQKGNELHVNIRKPNRLTGKTEIIWLAKVKTFGELDRIMIENDVNLCVIDALPNQHSARDFSRRFRGRVYLCYYQEQQKGEPAWHEQDTQGDRDYQVIVNRTEALDSMYEQVRDRKVAFPKLVPEVIEMREQLVNMARENVVDEDGTIKRAVWKRLGADHYAHSLSYSLLAQNRYGDQTPTSIVVKSPIMSRIIHSGRRVIGAYS